MAKCKFIYKGHRVFDSELALDEYIINTGKYRASTDEVFEKDEAASQRRLAIKTKIEEANKWAQEFMRNHLNLNDLDSEDFPEWMSKELDKGNYAVTEALKSFVSENGKLLFPLFNADNFWEHKFADWQNIEYWVGQVAVKKFDGSIEHTRASDEEIKAVFGDIKREDITKIPTKEQMDKGRKVMTNVWAMQGFIGSATHRMFKAYWDLNEATKGHMSDQDIREALVKSLNLDLVKNPKSEELKKFVGIKFRDIISDEAINNMVFRCKELHNKIKDQFRGDITIMAEQSIAVEIPDFINPDAGNINLIGNIDLVVITDSGDTHIIDYKTSPKKYELYNDVKRRTFSYQLATYQRMLQAMKLSISPTSGLFVVPIVFDKFDINTSVDFDDTDQEQLKNLVSFTGYSFGSANIIENLNIAGSPEYSNITKNVQKIIPVLGGAPIDETGLLDKVKTFTSRMFPMFGKANQVSKEWVDRKLKRNGADKPNARTKKYEFKVEGTEYINADSYEELLAKVYSKYKETDELLSTTTRGVKALLAEAKNNEGKLQNPITHKYNNGKHEAWMQTLIERYGNANYEVLTNYSDTLERLGIILLRNVVTGKIDVITVDNGFYDFEDVVYLGGDSAKNQKRTTLTGTFVNDTIAKNKPNELVMQSTYGNIRLMEVMAAINEMGPLFYGPGDQKGILGEVTLVNKNKNRGFSAPNEQLVYNFGELCREASRADNKEWTDNFANETIKAATYLDLVKDKASEILLQNRNFGGYGTITKDCVLFSDNAMEHLPELRTELLDLARHVEARYGLARDTSSINLFMQEKSEAYRFVSNIYSAISEIDGVKFKQQVVDHDNFLNQKSITDAIRNGWSGNKLDNPGMLDSDILNTVGKQVNVAYQNTRDQMLKISKRVQELSKKLKEEKGFSYLKSRTFGSEAALYKNMYQDRDDDLVFKNAFDPNETTLSDTERAFLQHSLFLINHDRYGINTIDELLAGINKDPHKFLKVPLTIGTTDSKVAYRGLWNHLKDVFDKLNPWSKNFTKNVREDKDNLLVDSSDLDENDERRTYETIKDDDTIIERQDKDKRNREMEHWQMTNEFMAGNNDKVREKMISEKGVNYFEHNLELLTMKHTYAYTLADNVNKIFPIIKACMLQLQMQGAIMNKSFAADIQYLHDFISAKILNLSLEANQWKQLSYVSSKLMAGASKLALAFSPRQLYQSIEGLWKDISLVIRKPDGTQAFTAQHMKEGFMWAYSDLTHNWGDKKSLGQILNEQYGINDMDMNSYIQKTRANQFGFWNFDNVMFHLASRPDFYNRMTIFAAHMKADGCFDAHDKEGNYDWTKDKRYELFAKYYDKEDQIPESLRNEYNKQKAHYHTVALQFQAEGAMYTDSDGIQRQFVLDIKHPKPLPRAYTVKEAESIKSICDMTYGYYSHEKRSLIQSTTLGAILMQMNTYWSSKKNQWMAPGGIRLQGRYEHYSETLPDGTEQFYYLDDDGRITTEVTDTPFMVWQGQYQEGIIVTLAHFLNTLRHGDENGNKGLINAWNQYYNNEDKNLRQAYRNNLWQFFYDLLMLIFGGIIFAPALENAAQKHAKETGNGDLGQAMINNTMVNLTAMLSSSFEDFNMAKSIFGRGMQWTPFSVSTITNTYKRISSCISGNSDLYDTMIKLSAATRSQQMMFDYVKINTLGRKFGDNGKPTESTD